MRWLEQLKQVRLSIKRKVAFYEGIYRDPRTPRLARILLWTALTYTLSPIDVIPDFIPIVGHLDDAIIVPLLILFASKLIPREVYEEQQNRAAEEYPRNGD